jgi:sigma-B regulation protein RsbU (phosphoserine phosphatase)
MALGVVEDCALTQRTVHLQPGDSVLLYTDGVTDATDGGLQCFGLDRLRRVILDHQLAPVADMVAVLERTIDDFTGGVNQFDDIAILAVKRLGT